MIRVPVADWLQRLDKSLLERLEISDAFVDLLQDRDLNASWKLFRCL